MTAALDQAPASTQPFRKGFFRRLFLAQLITGAVGLLGLLFMLGINLSQGRTTTRMAETLGPSERAAGQMLLGINRSVAALRGWVTLGDPKFLSEWEAAWKEDIYPAQAQLAAKNSLPTAYQANNELTALLRNLRESQWWVKDVARTPGNEGARVVLEREIIPLSRSIERSTEVRIKQLKKSMGIHGNERVVALSEILRKIGNSYYILERFLNEGSVNFKKQLLGEIASITNVLEQQQRIEIIEQGIPGPFLKAAQRDFDAYIKLVARSIQLREATDWNLSLYLLKTTTVPMAARASEIVKGMALSVGEQLNLESEAGMRNSRLATRIALLAFTLTVISTFIVSWLIGKRLTRPVTALAVAAQQFAIGQLDRDIPMPPIDELADLTISFNLMRSSVNKSMSELNRSNLQLRRRSAELDAVNMELESFAYSIAHDLRAPLRAIDGFSQILLEDYGESLDGEARSCLGYLREGSQEMDRLINDLLNLSRVTRDKMSYRNVDLSEFVTEILDGLRLSEPGRYVKTDITPAVVVNGDPRLLRVVMENLIGNAWKFTGEKPQAYIKFEAERINGRFRCVVRDNGAGFDMAFKNKLFSPFQRLHRHEEFEGSGIGLVTAQRIIHRHGGNIFAEGVPGEGASFTFELDAGEKQHA